MNATSDEVIFLACLLVVGPEPPPRVGPVRPIQSPVLVRYMQEVNAFFHAEGSSQGRWSIGVWDFIYWQRRQVHERTHD